MIPAEKYLLAAYKYYWCDSSIMSDQEFDALAKALLAEYERDVEDEGFSHLITRSDLECGSLLLSRDAYPKWVREAE